MTRELIGAMGLLAALLACGGCATSNYEPGYRYFPQPAVVDVIRRDGNHQSPLTVLATVVGVRRADAKQDIPYSVAVRLRFENVGQSRVSFDPRSLEMVTGTLRPFDPPVVRMQGPPDINPSERREVTAYFPFPPHTTAAGMNMRNLRLRWEVRIEGAAVPQSAVFERVTDGYYEDGDPYY